MFLALHANDPNAMMNLLGSKDADITQTDSRQRNILMYACIKKMPQDVIDMVLQLWPREFDWSQTDSDSCSALKFACASEETSMTSYILQRLSKLSLKERAILWDLVWVKIFNKSPDGEKFALQVLESPAAQDMFLCEDVLLNEILSFRTDGLVSGPRVVHKPVAKLLDIAITRRWTKLIKTMEATKPAIVRLVVFVCISDMAIALWPHIPDTLQSMYRQFSRDYLWCEVRHLLLARADCKSDACEFDRPSISDLPAVCFRNVVEFYQEPLDIRKVVKELYGDVCCSTNKIWGECVCRKKNKR